MAKRKLSDLVDKAMFRPGRMDMLVVTNVVKTSEQMIYRILKSIESDVEEKVLVALARKIFSVFKEEMPVSFYAHAIKLYKVYEDEVAVMNLLEQFCKHSKLFNYTIDDGKPEAKLGFARQEDGK